MPFRARGGPPAFSTDIMERGGMPRGRGDMRMRGGGRGEMRMRGSDRGMRGGDRGEEFRIQEPSGDRGGPSRGGTRGESRGGYAAPMGIIERGGHGGRGFHE